MDIYMAHKIGDCQVYHQWRGKKRRREKIFPASLKSRISPPSHRDETDMQQVNVQLENAKVDQRIQKCVTSSVSCGQHGGGGNKGDNALVRDVGMRINGGRDPSSIKVVRKFFDSVKIGIIARC